MDRKCLWVGLGIAAAAAMVGCSDKPPSSPTTSTTGAQMEAQSQINELERERDEARATLSRERATYEGARIRAADEQTAKAAHDQLEVRVLDALDKADQEMLGLRAKIAKPGANGVNAKQKQNIEKALVDAHAAKAKLYADLRKLHSGELASWDTFQANVDQTIGELQNTLAVEPTGPGKTEKAPAMPVTTPQQSGAGATKPVP
jgi:hypothetical protein